MKPNYTEEEYNNAKYLDKLPLQCLFCNDIFHKEKYQITRALNPNSKKKADYCSKRCFGKSITTSIIIKCTNCNSSVTKTPKDIKRAKNNFCSSECSGLYNSKHKTHGNNRSKLEIYLEKQLTDIYPSLFVDYNSVNAIGHELDIYIPSLNLAFELNGIFHYEPIFGIKRLESAQRNDISKSKSCLDNKIDLCTIDITGQKYFKESTSQKYLNIIINIINQRTV